VHGHPILGRDGKVKQIIEYSIDITGRKDAESLLLKAKEQAELIYKIIPSGIFTVDTERMITSWNNKAAEITGYSEAEIIGKTCATFAQFPCSERCRLFEGEASPLKTVMCSIKRKDGLLRALAKNTEHIRDTQGKIIGGIESFEDVTERSKAEEKIRMSAEEWSRTFDAISDMIFIHDIEGKLVKVNKAFAEAVELPPERIIGKTIKDLARENTLSWVEEVFPRTQGEVSPVSEEKFDTRHNQPLLVTAAVVVDSQGAPAGAVYVAKNISELKKAEEALQEHARKLAE
jgi:PAS domain S-box-containing protein